MWVERLDRVVVEEETLDFEPGEAVRLERVKKKKCLDIRFILVYIEI